MVPKLLALGPNVELQQYCGNLDEYLVGAGGGLKGGGQPVRLGDEEHGASARGIGERRGGSWWQGVPCMYRSRDEHLMCMAWPLHAPPP